MGLKFIAIAGVLGLAGLGITGCVETDGGYGGGYTRSSTVYVQEGYGGYRGSHWRGRDDHDWRRDRDRDRDHRPPPPPGRPGGGDWHRPPPPGRPGAPTSGGRIIHERPAVPDRSAMPVCRAGMDPTRCNPSRPGH